MELIAGIHPQLPGLGFEGGKGGGFLRGMDLPRGARPSIGDTASPIAPQLKDLGIGKNESR